MRPAITVNQLSKCYRLAATRGVYGYRSLRETISNGAAFWRHRNGAGRTSSTEFWALKDVSFEINHGDVVGVIGRNGAGKSTLLKVLSRITVPTSGSADVDGR